MDDGNSLTSVIFIEYGDAQGDGESCATLNAPDSGKRKRTTPEQFDKLISFMQTHPDFTKGTSKADEEQEIAWNVFTDELNEIGPPVHSSKEWRTVWSQYKANKKRKRTVESNAQSSLESCYSEKTG